jgi:hypothetical protein
MKPVKYFVIVSILNIAVYSQQESPGAFTRLGFSARGISMGNAMTSLISGDVMDCITRVSSYQDDHLINLSYSFLSLDRRLNFVTYTKISSCQPG